MDERTSTPYDSYTALNRAMLLRPDKDDELLASILKDSTIKMENPARALIQYTDKITGKTYGSILIHPDIEQIYSEETMRKVAAPQLWSRVTMGRVQFYAK